MSGGGFEEEAEETVSINEYIQNMEDEELVKIPSYYRNFRVLFF